MFREVVESQPSQAALPERFSELNRNTIRNLRDSNFNCIFQRRTISLAWEILRILNPKNINCPNLSESRELGRPTSPVEQLWSIVKTIAPLMIYYEPEVFLEVAREAYDNAAQRRTRKRKTPKIPSSGLSRTPKRQQRATFSRPLKVELSHVQFKAIIINDLEDSRVNSTQNRQIRSKISSVLQDGSEEVAPTGEADELLNVIFGRLGQVALLSKAMGRGDPRTSLASITVTPHDLNQAYADCIDQVSGKLGARDILEILDQKIENLFNALKRNGFEDVLLMAV